MCVRGELRHKNRVGTLFIVFFFQSNLRTNLMVNGYEKAFVTNADIVNSKRRAYPVAENYYAKYEMLNFVNISKYLPF